MDWREVQLMAIISTNYQPSGVHIPLGDMASTLSENAMSNQAPQSKLSQTIGLMAARIAEKLLVSHTITPPADHEATRTYEVLVTQTMKRTIAVTVEDSNVLAAMEQAAALAATIQDADWDLQDDPIHVECKVIK